MTSMSRVGWIRTFALLAVLVALAVGCQSGKQNVVAADQVTCPQCTAEPKAPDSHDLIASSHRCPECKILRDAANPHLDPYKVVPQERHECALCRNASTCALCMR